MLANFAGYADLLESGSGKRIAHLIAKLIANLDGNPYGILGRKRFTAFSANFVTAGMLPRWLGKRKCSDGRSGSLRRSRKETGGVRLARAPSLLEVFADTRDLP